MKRLLISLAIALATFAGCYAQDARNRAKSTIVADVLAQMPAYDLNTFNQAMADLASTGSEGVIQMADMLVPADKGQNSKIEYAINGLVGYVFAPGREAQRNAVREGLKTAMEKCTDNPNRAFLLNMLQRLGNPEDAEFFAKYVADPYLQEWALNGLVAIPESEQTLLNVVKSGVAPRSVLAYAAGKKGLLQAEPILLEWVASATPEETRAFYKALGEVGSSASLPVLAKAAKAQNYEWLPDGATESYIRLLDRLAKGPDAAKAASAAKSLLKVTDKPHVRGAAMNILFEADGKKSLPMLLKTMKDNDRAIRVNALRRAEPWADEDVYAALGKIAAAKGTQPAKADIINWLGTNHVNSQIDAVISNINSQSPEIAESSIKAASKIGGQKALDALVAQLDGNNAEIASDALLTFNGKVNDGILKALEGSDVMKTAALGIASTRKMKEASPKVFELLNSGNADVATAAYKALAGVSSQNDIQKLANLLETCQLSNRDAVNTALLTALSTLSSEDQYNTLKPLVSKTKTPFLYYPALAQTAMPDAITTLRDGYEKGNAVEKEAALKALLSVKSNNMIDVLFNMAQNGAGDQALYRYADLVSTSGYAPEWKFPLFKKGLEATKNAGVQNRMLSGLSETGLYQALMVATDYIDKPETSREAAAAVRSIASRISDRFKGEQMKNALVKARDVYKAGGSADDGYAVDDINGLIAKLDASPASPIFKLSPEEEKEGFRVLFDGTNLDNFVGNKTGYIPVDGNIYVSAVYGEGGNLYTKDEFSDFIYRFEFCFETEGVNNGIGIRTPMGVDAAYEGMEIQVLDHDAPIYKGLRPYQVHGSVYGIIPAKRIVHKPRGEWSTEEIRAVGDHITVTVNGEVIVDGNIREACQGHNVAPDGSGQNPYTVDHLNHPGLFNKKGHIGFLGHGEGVKFRNVRVKDLSKEATKGKKKATKK